MCIQNERTEEKKVTTKSTNRNRKKTENDTEGNLLC